MVFKGSVSKVAQRERVLRLTTGVLWSARPPARRILVFKLLSCALPRARPHIVLVVHGLCGPRLSLPRVSTHTSVLGLSLWVQSDCACVWGGVGGSCVSPQPGGV